MKQKPHNLLLLAALIFVLISFFVSEENGTVDLHLHDTYFIIAHTHVFWLLAILSLFSWIIYALTEKILFSKVLTWTHVVITMLTLVLFALVLSFGDRFQPRRYYSYSIWDSFNDFDGYTKTITITMIILLLGQITFVINLIGGLFKRWR